MNKITFLFIAFVALSLGAIAQPTIYPAPANEGYILIKNATIHVGNGNVINNGSILINKNKIEKVGSNITVPAGAQTIDASGKHVYPGLISSSSNLGLKEVAGSVRGTDDFDELGEITPSIRSIVAYNTDSRVINVLRTNGILFSNVIPQDEGGSSKLISGTSSVVQLDAWNWEDAAYQMDGQMHFNMPSFIARRSRFFAPSGPQPNPAKEALDKVDRVKSFFKSAKAYLAESSHKATNLNYEATKKLFDKNQKFFVHCDGIKEMLVALDFKKEFGFDVVIVGGADSWQIAPLLKQNNVAVILGQSHALPLAYDDDVDQPYKTPFILQKAGVLFAIADNDGTTRGRNLMFSAGTAASYGLTKE
ncbi:MAG: amidohydrolase, partial [Ginsengibacter sp.]